MKVIAHDPFVSEEALAAMEVDYIANINDGLAQADYLTVHMPPSQNGALIGAREMALMKPSSIIINTARGGLVDELSLDAALREGRIYGAGFDVLVEEPPKSNHPLLSNSRFTLSPHAAGLTQECAARMAVSAVQNVLDCFNGKLDQKLVVNADHLKR
jgi:D-3-phosphoglycerate dehydrogenase